MEELLTKLNKHFDDKYASIKLFDVVYDKTSLTCTFCFLFPQNADDMTSEDRQNIANFIKNFFALNGDVKVKFKKSFLDESIVKKEVENYFKECHKGLVQYINPANISSKNTDGLNVDIVIKMNEDILDLIDEKAIKQKLIAYLCRRFIAIFSVSLQEDETRLPDEIEAVDLPISQTKAVPRYEVQIIKKAIGGDIQPRPEYIKNIKSPKNSVILAGRPSDFIKKTYTRKSGKKKGEEGRYYRFNLKDSAIMECIYFCGKTNEKIMDSIVENYEQLMLLCVGDVEIGLSGKLNYRVHKITLCSPVERKKEVVIEHSEQELDLETIKNKKPVASIEAIERTAQDSLFAEKPKYNDMIMNNPIVVFDFETTGLDTNSCEVTEIGAVKIENGQIKERFYSFCKTKYPIPEHITEKTGITNEMIADGANINDIIIDFYNYSRGCLISGYNIVGYDMKILNRLAKNLGLKFDNQVVDVFILARQSGVKTGNLKLETVAKAVGVNLVGAHRAYNDAHATAQVLLEFSKLKK